MKCEICGSSKDVSQASFREDTFTLCRGCRVITDEFNEADSLGAAVLALMIPARVSGKKKEELN